MYDFKMICKYAKIVSYNYYWFQTHGEYKTISEDKYLDIVNYFEKNYRFEWRRAFQINNNYYHKLKRLRDRINHIIFLPSVFLTITFKTDVLENTSPETRRKYVQRFLKSYNVPFVANIDYGKKNGREHYHCLIASQDIDYTSFKYGAVNGEKVRNFNNDDIKLSKYICKFSNHAIKDTTKHTRIIYSR